MALPPNAVELPDSVADTIETIRNTLVRNVAGAAAELDGALRKSADRVQRELLEAADLSPAHRKRRIRSILKRYHAADADRISEIISSQLDDAAGLAARYSAALSLYKLTEAQLITKTKAQALLANSSEPARVALAYEARKLRKGPPPKPVTKADREAIKFLSPFRGTSNVSKALHGKAVANSRAAANAVLRGIREMEGLSETARNMQRVIRSEGARIAANDKLPKLLEELQQHGKALAKTAGPDELAAWNATVKKLDRYQKGLRETGTVRKSYLELLQTVQSKDFRADQLGKTIERWTYHKQRYRAETWARTETASAYRNMALERDRDRAWVVGYIWRMQAATHNRWTQKGKAIGRIRHFHSRRKPGKQKKFGGNHCICEVYNGRRFSPETARYYGSGSMGHPHCNCYWEPVIDRQAMINAPPTAEELDWLND